MPENRVHFLNQERHFIVPPLPFLSPKSYTHVSKFAEQSRYLLLLKKAL